MLCVLSCICLSDVLSVISVVCTGGFSLNFCLHCIVKGQNHRVTGCAKNNIFGVCFYDISNMHWWIFTGRQRSCKPCTSYDRDVRLSVCLSVTHWHWVKTTQARITKSSPTDSPMTLVFGIKNSFRNSKGVTPSEGVKWEWGRENSQFSANNSPYLRNGAR